VDGLIAIPGDEIRKFGKKKLVIPALVAKRL